MVASLGYVGAVSRHLQTFPNPNGQMALTPNSFSGYIDTAGDKINPLQPYPHFGGPAFTAYDAVSNYNSLQGKIEKRLSRGLSFLATYTWSHSLDDAPTPLGSTSDGGYRSLNILGMGADYGSSPFDVRQRFTLNGNYELPFGKGRQFVNTSSLLNYIVGGWSDSFVFKAQTGEPITIGTNGFTEKDVNGNVIASYAGPSGSGINAVKIGNPLKAGGTANSTNPTITCPTKVRTVHNWYNPCAFANPDNDNIGYTTATYPDSPKHQPIPNTVSGAAALPYVGSPRGATYGPGYVRIDMSLFKSFPTFREQYLQFRADMFNALNTPAYGDPSNAGISSNGGLITGARSFQSYTPDSRFFQFSLKYAF